MTRNVVDLEELAVGAYLGLALGDALGATVEFMTPSEIRIAYGVHDSIRGGGWLKLKPGQVTDDTQMSLALGRTLINSGRIDAFDIAEAFSNWMSSKPVDIGNTVRRGIIHYRHSGQAHMKVSEHDAGNGACMRILPIALASYGWDEESVRKACECQSHITHNNDVSDAAVFCIVRMLHMILAGSQKSELLQGPVASLISHYPRFEFRGRACDNPSGYIVDTLRTVFNGFFNSASFSECLISVVNQGGDADTTGAIAGMLAGCYYGEIGLPDAWISSLDGDVRGQCIVQALDLLDLPIVLAQDHEDQRVQCSTMR